MHLLTNNCFGLSGLVLSSFNLAYTVSKFVCGIYSDRANNKLFLLGGLLLSGILVASVSGYCCSTCWLGRSAIVTLWCILVPEVVEQCEVCCSGPISSTDGPSLVHDGHSAGWNVASMCQNSQRGIPWTLVWSFSY